jgi:uncharacterized OsmC-like protein
MATITLKYLGELRIEATHSKSASKLISDAPSDNEGKGESFSPSDLFCSSLATCMLTIMGISMRNHAMKIGEITSEITKHMESNPRRVGTIDILFIFESHALSEKEKNILKIAAETCPVALSISNNIHVNLSFSW